MKKITFICVLSLALQGCIAGAFVAGSAATGNFVTDPRSVGTIKNDEQITYRVNKALANDPVMSSQTHVAATSYNQVVLLTGQAYDEALRAKAEEYATQTPEVKRVFNEIALGIPTAALQRTKDVAITSAVKVKMFANRELKSNSFKIVTENGVVYILGIATPKQADLAVTIARNSAGVKKVVKLIQSYEE